MALWAMIVRELSEAARRKRTFWVRFLYGAALALPLLVSYPFVAGSPQNVGTGLFGFFVYWQLALVLLLAPASAVSSVSDERDSGTLGLLLLTRLTPAGIVAGKLVVQFGSLAILLVSGLPMLFFATMLGGVSATQILQTFLVTAWTGFVVAAFGLAVSSYVERTYKAAVVVYLTLFLALFVPFIILQFWAIIFGRGVMPTLPHPLLLLSSVRAGAASWIQILGFIGLMSAGTALLLLVARRGVTRYLHQDEPRAARSRAFARTPDVRRRGVIQGNPIVWRETRKNALLLRPWLLMVLGLLVLSPSFLWEGFSMMWLMVSGLIWMIIYILVLVRASLLFTEEKEGGSLQLLLATALTDREIVEGKLRVLVREYGPYALILCLLGAGAHLVSPSYPEEMGIRLYATISPLTALVMVATVSLCSSLVSATATRAVVLSIGCYFGYYLVLSIPGLLLGLLFRGGVVVLLFFHLFGAWLVFRWMVRNLRAYCARS